MARHLGGTLALRQHWCRPDEVIRLVAAFRGSGVRFDVPGLSWEGRTGGRAAAEGIERGMIAADQLISGSWEIAGASPPRIVYFGPGVRSQVLAAAGMERDSAAELMWVLTSQRTALLRRRPESVAEDGGGLWDRARRFGAGVRGFSREVVDVVRDDRLGGHPAGAPVPLAAVDELAQLTGATVVGLSRRRLPSEHGERDSAALRIGLDDRSGFDIIAPTDDDAHRLHALATGQK
ncbi:hypothetical protein [Saccharopolyspora cebuensis]|uniref:Uncharacterized protein n=1 Tax=Saccharopolyspora cebuensis TaxID=418759 RepID=A0ABV4CRD9_9PSEU